MSDREIKYLNRTIEKMCAQLDAYRQENLNVINHVQALGDQFKNLQATVSQAAPLAPAQPPPQPNPPGGNPQPAPAPGGVVPVPLPGPHLPNVMTPPIKRFAGDPRECKSFLLQCKLQYRARPQCFLTDEQKISFVLMHLDGPALCWAEPYLERNDPILISEAPFLKAFLNVFERKYHDEARRQEFLNLRQGSLELTTYLARFTALASETGWPENAQVALLHKGLREDMKDYLLHVHPLPENLHEFINLILRIEHRQQERRGDKKRDLRNIPFVNTPVNSKAENDTSEPMILGEVRAPLTPQERERRRTMKLCFYCGKAGHSIKQCTIRPPQGNANTLQAGRA